MVTSNAFHERFVPQKRGGSENNNMKNQLLLKLVVVALIVSVSLNIVSYANYMQSKTNFMNQAYSNLLGIVISLDGLSRGDVSPGDAESLMSSLEDICIRMDETLAATTFVSSAYGFADFEHISQWKIVYGEENGYDWNEITDYAERWSERLMILLQELSKNGELSYSESNVMQQNPNYFMSARNINRIFNVYFEEIEKEITDELQGW
ncbi:MAG: hypothetical protein LBT26_08305 [Clostridiales Family XIII bacterium]|jgi:hypothetical protein|nr:hypothetical protein [Clostridiales Family XIII bacterium]